MMKRTKLNFNLSSLISHLSSRDGFTLIELLVVILVIFSVGVLISSVLFSALRGANKTNTIDLVRRNGNSAITQMSRMIRYSQSFDGVSTDGVAYTTSCVLPIAASSPSVVSSPPFSFFSWFVNILNPHLTKISARVNAFISSLIPGFNKESSIVQIARAVIDPTEHPLQDKGLGAATAAPGDYNMGYKFTPNVNGQITQLGLRCESGTKTVRLFDSTGTTVLASASVTAAGVNTWVYTSITPVSVTAGTSYIVAWRAGAGNACFNSLITPYIQGNVTVNSSNYKLASNDMISSTVVTDTMYGQADVGFVPPTPTPTPTIIPTPTITPTPTPPAPTPTPIQYHYARVTGFDGGKTTFRCDKTTVLNPLGIASNSASLIDTSSVDVSSCYFTCSQNNIISPPNIGISFSLTQKGTPQFFENKAKADFQTSVSVRNY